MLKVATFCKTTCNRGEKERRLWWMSAVWARVIIKPSSYYKSSPISRTFCSSQNMEIERAQYVSGNSPRVIWTRVYSHFSQGLTLKRLLHCSSPSNLDLLVLKVWRHYIAVLANGFLNWFTWTKWNKYSSWNLLQVRLVRTLSALWLPGAKTQFGELIRSRLTIFSFHNFPFCLFAILQKIKWKFIPNKKHKRQDVQDITHAQFTGYPQVHIFTSFTINFQLLFLLWRCCCKVCNGQPL